MILVCNIKNKEEKPYGVDKLMRLAFVKTSLLALLMIGLSPVGNEQS
jgi:hypothetical protein